MKRWARGMSWILCAALLCGCSAQTEGESTVDVPYQAPQETVQPTQTPTQAPQSALATPTPTAAPQSATPRPTATPKATAKPTVTAPPTPSPAASPTQRPTATPRAQSFVAELDVAQKTDQLVVVLARGSSATVSFHQKQDGLWQQVFSVNGRIGKNGLGKTKEGDGKTPSGVYSFTQAFGVAGNPGTRFAYTKVDQSHYWVDDSDSAYYNRLVSTDEVQKDWDSAEHLIEMRTAYAYALALNYNSTCTPGKGSAIFLHCDTGRATAGCISIPQAQMRQLLKTLSRSARILITTEKGLSSY